MGPQGQIQGIKDFLEKSIETIDNMSKREIDSSLDQLDSVLLRHYNKRFSYIYKKQVIQNQVRKMMNIPEEGEKLKDLKKDYKRLLSIMLDEINRLGLPGKEDITIDPSGKVYQQLSHGEQPSQKEQVSLEEQQPQVQLTDVLIKTMEDQMSSAQWEELKTLIRKVRNREEAKSRISEKLRSYGLEECLSILANILTNPEIIDAF
ncbi:MAG: hypothetical protein ACLFM7_13010 [Bacteroidales bacterium]